MSTPQSKGLQCKDIDDELFLACVDACAYVRQDGSKGWSTHWDVQLELSRRIYDKTVLTIGDFSIAMTELGPFDPEMDQISEKLVVAKARKLILSGRMDGCYCGCRGDFKVITDAG